MIHLINFRFIITSLDCWYCYDWNGFEVSFWLTEISFRLINSNYGFETRVEKLCREFIECNQKCKYLISFLYLDWLLEFMQSNGKHHQVSHLTKRRQFSFRSVFSFRSWSLFLLMHSSWEWNVHKLRCCKIYGELWWWCTEDQHLMFMLKMEPKVWK